MNFEKVAGVLLAVGLGVALTGSAMASSALIISKGPLLSGPGADYVKLVDLPATMHVNIVWCGLHDNKWCLVDEHNKLGWVRLDNLTMRAGGSPLTTVSIVGGHPAIPAPPTTVNPMPPMTMAGTQFGVIDTGRKDVAVMATQIKH